MGNEYGGFFVAHEFVNKDSIIYSFGVGEDITFDEGLISEFGCQVFAFDPTPKSIKWVNGRTNPEEFKFAPFGIDKVTGKVNFLLPKNDAYVSGSAINQMNVDEQKTVEVNMKTLADIATELGHKKIEILKMDIEGSEYSILDSILNAPVNIHQICVEIHERFFEDGKKKTEDLILKLKKYGYELFAISKSYEELSFIKIDIKK
ncbi:FkbM family methyltransferase [Frigoriflavimonas asaccharolytica]|uniref:FkbM family methyltransferase n=1 Tax=Frigoriflavimonas asaccharolytica TaxID=2735899 RepID=UPI001D007E6F|nr:FkbM family methyltransferase [Frigoriflavimonas asaccharolytica]